MAAVLAAAVVTAFTLLGGGEPYRVNAQFQNASQLVKGNLVQVAGRPMGKVEKIALTRDGQAQVTLTIDDAFAPLRRGTLITVRQASLSGIANRYLDLRLAPSSAPELESGGTILATDTTTAVDLDQLFNTFDPKTVDALRKVVRGSGKQYEGNGQAYGEGLMYLNPGLSSSSRLFRELNRDTPLLEDFVVSSSKLVTDIADRHEELAGLVDRLATTTTALGDEKEALAESIERLPDFMRRANTTFLNLRSALDDLDPLVEDSKPVAKKLRPFLAELRPLARDARPTLRNLSRLIKRTGADNDLIELTNLQPSVAEIAVGPVRRNDSERQGALPASTKALGGSTPKLAFARPYTPDAMGWFDDFSHSGVYDALGGVSRVSLHASAFTLVGGQLQAVPPELRDLAFLASGGVRDQRNRCPGAAEPVRADGSGPWRPSPDFNCNPDQVLPGD